jgi:hypothetical protein
MLGMTVVTVLPSANRSAAAWCSLSTCVVFLFDGLSAYGFVMPGPASRARSTRHSLANRLGCASESHRGAVLRQQSATGEVGRHRVAPRTNLGRHEVFRSRSRFNGLPWLAPDGIATVLDEPARCELRSEGRGNGALHPRNREADCRPAEVGCHANRRDRLSDMCTLPDQMTQRLRTP